MYYRVGTSDVHVIDSILFKKGKKAEYWIPRRIHPTTILDIGGNIGAAAICFAHTYPQARVYTFEPMPESFDLLQRNVAPYHNIQAFNVALGLRDATLELVEAPNTRNIGGYSLYQRDATPECKRFPVQCRAIEPFLKEINAAAPDLIKIDTEGAEFEILTALSEKTIADVKWIVGELHGERDFELLSYLSKWFEIGIKKSVNRPLCKFHGRNRRLVA